MKKLAKIFASLNLFLLILFGCKTNESTYLEDNYSVVIKFKYYLINYDEFKAKVVENERFLAIFTRSDCEYCITFIENFSELMNEKFKKYHVYFIDTSTMSADEKEDILINFDISSVPSIASVKGGKIINLEIGEPSKEKMTEIIEDLLGG